MILYVSNEGEIWCPVMIDDSPQVGRPEVKEYKADPWQSNRNLNGTDWALIKPTDSSH